MNSEGVIAALAIPPDALVNQRVPKKLLIEQGAPPAADKRQINDGLEELQWVAALKSSNIGVPVFRDHIREYVEIAVLSASLRSASKSTRIIELIHRAIPYPVVLITSLAETVTFSVAHKRWSQGQSGQMVLDDDVSIAVLAGTPEEAAFTAALPVSRQPQLNLFALYHGWLCAVTALSAARITGTYTLQEAAGNTESRRAALDEYSKTVRELAALRASAEKEKQINRRVQLNINIKDLEARLASLASRL